jgi:hypothetical protein
MPAILPMLWNKRPIDRMPKNPMDKCTLVSIYPREIIQKNETTEPRVWKIAPGSFEEPSVTVIGPASWFKDVGDDQPILEIPNSSVQVAESIVRDYCIGMLEVRVPIQMPGIFWVPGNLPVSEIKQKYAVKLVQAKAVQDQYYHALVKLADSLWNMTDGNPMAIADDMRLAASELGIQDRDWMQQFELMNKQACPACGMPRKLNYPVCPNCKVVIDQEKAKKMGLVFAQ